MHSTTIVAERTTQAQSCVVRRSSNCKSPPPLNFNAGCRDIMVGTSCFASACRFACQNLDTKWCIVLHASSFQECAGGGRNA